MRAAVLDRTRDHFHIRGGASLVSMYVENQKLVFPLNSRALRHLQIQAPVSNRKTGVWKKIG